MYLVLLQIESGCGFIVLDRKYGLAIFIDRTDVIAEFELKASLPPLKTVAFPDLKQSAKASEVTLGRDS